MRLFLLQPLLLLSIMFLASCKPSDDISRLPNLNKNKKEIVFVTHNGPTTYYLNSEGQAAGIEHDLAELFVKQYYPEHQLRFVLVNSISDVIPSLLKNKAHIAAANLTVTHLRQHLVLFAPAYQETQQQLIFNNEINKKPKKLAELIDKKLAVPEGTSYAEQLTELQQENPVLQWQALKRTNTELLLEEVADGVLDYTVADSHLVAVMQNYYPQLQVAQSISPKEKIAWAMSKNTDPEMIKNIHAFFNTIKNNGTLRNLLDRYYGHSERLNTLDITTFLKRINTLLPKYIHLFKQAQEITGIDWRLLAAVSYRESHWDTFNTSPTNVRGLMMLTEATADQMGVTDRLDPKQSIPAGAKYLLKLRDTVPERIPEPDRTYMALAAYNIGYAHVEDARVLAKRLRLNPDSWADVKKTLVLLKNPEYYTTLKYGYASGGAPVIFVESVRSYQRILEKYKGSHHPDIYKLAAAR